MNYLQLVQKMVRKSGAKVDVPTTVVGQTGITEMFVEWIADAWKDIQLERLGLAWRTSRGLTFNLVAGTHEYGLDSTLESINTRSVTCHLGGVNESPVCFQRYDYYLTEIDRQTRMSGKPQYFSFTPDNNWVFWPNPDDTYAIVYEGVLEVEIFDSTDVAGAGTSDLLEPTALQPAYHDAIVWQALLNYGMHFEDGSKLSEAQVKFRPYKKYFEERFMPIVTVNTSALYQPWLYYSRG